MAWSWEIPIYHEEKKDSPYQMNQEAIISRSPTTHFDLFIGETGAGKSSLINALLGRDAAAMDSSVICTAKLAGYSWGETLLIDTPGFMNAARSHMRPGYKALPDFCQIWLDHGEPKLRSIVICQSVIRPRVTLESVNKLIAKYNKQSRCVICVTFMDKFKQDDRETLAQLDLDNVHDFNVVHWDSKKPISSQREAYDSVLGKIPPEQLDLNFFHELLKFCFD
jgi:putative ribosome biogenesis GTPase RsgA